MEIEFFDSFDDMMKRLQKAMNIADARVRPWQAAIIPGDYFLRSTELGRVAVVSNVEVDSSD